MHTAESESGSLLLASMHPSIELTFIIHLLLTSQSVTICAVMEGIEGRRKKQNVNVTSFKGKMDVGKSLIEDQSVVDLKQKMSSQLFVQLNIFLVECLPQCFWLKIGDTPLYCTYLEAFG